MDRHDLRMDITLDDCLAYLENVSSHLVPRFTLDCMVTYLPISIHMYNSFTCCIFIRIRLWCEHL